MATKLGHEMWGTRRVLKIRCECGQELFCPNFTNTCDCGRDYNWAGQLLAPRSQWGEETGETAEQILSYDNMTTEELFNTED